MSSSTNHPVRIVYVHGSANMYGASRSLLRVSSYLSGDFEPLVVLTKDGPLVEELKAAGVPVTICKWMHRTVLGRQAFHGFNLFLFVLYFIPNIVRFALFLRRHKADLVHSNSIVVMVPAFAAKVAGIPHIWHVRETIDQYSKMWSQFAETERSLVWRLSTLVALRLWPLYVRLIYALSSYVMCVSHAAFAPFARLGLNRRAGVVHNGIQLDYYRQPGIAPMSLDAWLDGSAPWQIVGTIGAIRAQKGQHVLIRAFAKLKDRHPNAPLKCLIVGDYKVENFAYFEKLRELIQSSRLENDVIFTGHVSDPRTAFACLEVFVLPSVQPEPFGTVVLEAMAMQVPVIATNLGGTVDQIEDGKSGLLVPPGNEDALADAMETLLFDKSLQREFTHNALERVSRLYTVENHMQHVESIYRRLLARQNDAAQTG